jgi:hypothetical protein
MVKDTMAWPVPVYSYKLKELPSQMDECKKTSRRRDKKK